MGELYGSTYRDAVRPAAISATKLLGQVMFLVAVALGFAALGTLVGRDLPVSTARLLSFAGFGMLLVSSFAGERFRVGSFAMFWLFATALVIGLGLLRDESFDTLFVTGVTLAVAAIPGSIFPQRMANPNGVTQWESDNPDLFPIVDALQLFDVYQSVWFSAIYLLLFVSLVGCILPRTKHHIKALRQRPPRPQARRQASRLGARPRPQPPRPFRPPRPSA